MAETLCLKMGGGGGKGTLLWTNPNPNSVISSNIDIPIDWNAYSHIYCDLRYAYDTTYEPEYKELKSDLTYVNKNTSMTFSRAEPSSAGDMTVGFRYYKLTTSGITIMGTAGYVNVNSGSRYTSNVFCIPVAIYGK